MRGEALAFLSNFEGKQRFADPGRAGLVDIDRVLVLRTASNFTMPPQGQTAVWSKTQPFPDNGEPALEAAFVVGNTVVQALLDGWEKYGANLPMATSE